jgi:spermidine synthase
MGEIPTEPKGIRQLGAALAAMPHPPKNVLVLGLGAGTFVRELVRFPSVASITVVDWSRELPPLLSDKDVVSRVGATLSDPRIRLLSEDARLMVKLLPKGHFDLVLDNLVYPTWAGATGVRTDSFFANVSYLLTPDGVYGITTNYARWRGEMLAGLIKNFHRVYENEKGYMVVATNVDALLVDQQSASQLTDLLWPASVAEKSEYEIGKKDYRSMLTDELALVAPSTISAHPFTEERLFSEYYYTSREFLTFLRR